MEEKIRKALTEVIDPELGISIVDLGLVYKIEAKKGEAKIEMTLTSPGCPLAGVIDKMVREAVLSLEEIEKVDLQVVWDPPWTPEHMSESAKAELGFD